MALKLIVTRHFEDFEPGQEITDPEAVARYGESHPHFVVRTDFKARDAVVLHEEAAPAPEPAPVEPPADDALPAPKAKAADAGAKS